MILTVRYSEAKDLPVTHLAPTLLPSKVDKDIRTWCRSGNAQDWFALGAVVCIGGDDEGQK